MGTVPYNKNTNGLEPGAFARYTYGSVADAEGPALVSPGGLVKAVAEALGVSEATVVVHDRNLASVGLRRKGGRGRSAAVMTPHDAAALLISVMASPDAVSSATVTRWYADLVASARGFSDLSTVEEAEMQHCQWDHWPDVPGQTMKKLPSGHTFLDAVAALIADAPSFEIPWYMGKALWADVRVSVFDPIPSAMIEIAWTRPMSEYQSITEAWANQPEDKRGPPPEQKVHRAVFFQDSGLPPSANSGQLRKLGEYLNEKYGERYSRVLRRRSSIKLSALLHVNQALNP